MNMNRYKNEMSAIKPDQELITRTKLAVRAETNYPRKTGALRLRVSFISITILIFIVTTSTTILAVSNGWIDYLARFLSSNGIQVSVDDLIDKVLLVDGQTNDVFDDIHLCFDVNCTDVDLAAFNQLRAEVLSDPANFTTEVSALENGTSTLIISYNTRISDTIHLSDETARMTVYSGIPMYKLSTRFTNAADTSVHDRQCDYFDLIYTAISETHSFDASTGGCRSVVVTISSTCRSCVWAFDISGHKWDSCGVIHKEP